MSVLLGIVRFGNVMLNIICLFSFFTLKADLFPAAKPPLCFRIHILTSLTDFISFFFFLLLSYCFLQKETRGPLRPRRPRAPPAKKPREVEVHPKLGLRPKGVKSREEASERGETWRKDRVCIGRPDRRRGNLCARRRPVWSIGAPNVSPFHWLRLYRAEQN